MGGYVDLGPVAGAEQVAGVDLGDLHDLVAADHREVHGLLGVARRPAPSPGGPGGPAPPTGRGGRRTARTGCRRRSRRSRRARAGRRARGRRASARSSTWPARWTPGGRRTSAARRPGPRRRPAGRRGRAPGSRCSPARPRRVLLRPDRWFHDVEPLSHMMRLDTGRGFRNRTPESDRMTPISRQETHIWTPLTPVGGGLLDSSSFRSSSQVGTSRHLASPGLPTCSSTRTSEPTPRGVIRMVAARHQAHPEAPLSRHNHKRLHTAPRDLGAAPLPASALLAQPPYSDQTHTPSVPPHVTHQSSSRLRNTNPQPYHRPPPISPPPPPPPPPPPSSPPPPTPPPPPPPPPHLSSPTADVLPVRAGSSAGSMMWNCSPTS